MSNKIKRRRVESVYRYDNERRFRPKEQGRFFVRRKSDAQKISEREEARQIVERMRGRLHY